MNLVIIRSHHQIHHWTLKVNCSSVQTNTQNGAKNNIGRTIICLKDPDPNT